MRGSDSIREGGFFARNQTRKRRVDLDVVWADNCWRVLTICLRWTIFNHVANGGYRVLNFGFFVLSLDEGHQLPLVVQARQGVYGVGDTISNGYVGSIETQDEVQQKSKRV